MSSNSAPKVSKVPVGATSVLGGGVTVAAYAGAVVAFIQGARDGETLSLLAVGTIGLVSTLAGRYGQAIAALLNAMEVATVAPADPKSYGTGKAQNNPHAATQNMVQIFPHDDEDKLDPIFNGLETDPKSIPPDKGDGKAGRRELR